jgi:chromosome segregation ATPase
MVEEQLNILQQENISLQQQLTDLRQNQETLQQQLNVLQPENANLQQQLTTSQQNQETLQQQLTTSQQNQETLQQQLTTSQQNQETLQQQLTTSQQNLEALQQQLTTSQQNQETLQQQLTTSQQNQETLQQQLNVLQPENTSLQQQLTTLQQNYDNLQRQFNASQEQLSSARSETASNQKQLDEISEKYAKLCNTSGIEKLRDLLKQLTSSQIDALHEHTTFRVDTIETVHSEKQVQCSSLFVQLNLQELKCDVDSIIQLQKNKLAQMKQAKESVTQALITAGASKGVVDAAIKPVETEIEQIEAGIEGWNTFSAFLVHAINQSNSANAECEAKT